MNLSTYAGGAGGVGSILDGAPSWLQGVADVVDQVDLTGAADGGSGRQGRESVDTASMHIAPSFSTGTMNVASGGSRQNVDDRKAGGDLAPSRGVDLGLVGLIAAGAVFAVAVLK